MRPPTMRRHLAGLLLVSLAAAGGCGQSTEEESTRVATSGQEFLLSTEPAGALSVTEARETLAAQPDAADVIVIGRIGGLSQPTWDPARAAFMMADLSAAPPDAAKAEAHEPGASHDADNCPFCRAKRKKELASLALVQIVDAQGTTPAIDARELLGLNEGETVVVQGQAQLDKLDALVVRARGIFVRPRTED